MKRNVHAVIRRSTPAFTQKYGEKDKEMIAGIHTKIKTQYSSP